MGQNILTIGFIWKLLLKVRSLLPAPMRSLLTFAFYAILDACEFIMRKERKPGIPPKRLMVGGKRTTEEFIKVGEEFFAYIRDICSLQPNERVLDVGCGIGQKMLPLLKYLDEIGSYEGFDIDRKRISWLNGNVTNQNSRFKFQVCDLYNALYNSQGTIVPSSFRFPYDENEFDFVLCTSVFTHMLAGDMSHYLAEIRRVLRPGGRCLLSFFILRSDALTLMNNGKSTLAFRHELDRCMTTDSRLPEAAIAYDETLLRELLNETDLRIREPVFYGSWCGRETFLSYQDLVIADKSKT